MDTNAEDRDGIAVDLNLLPQIGQNSLKAYVQAIQSLLEQDEHFDAITAAGDSGQLAARITEEVYKALGKPVPPKLVAPVYRHADEAETVLFDNSVMASQFEDWRAKPLRNILFVDDEIGSGNAMRGMIDLLLELSPSVQAFTIVAEDGGFDCPPEIHGVKTRFIPTRSRVPGVYNAISYTIPWRFQEPLKEVLADEPDLNDKQVMCTLLNLPTKEFNDGQPEFNDRLIKRAQQTLPNFPELQKEYKEYFTSIIERYLVLEGSSQKYEMQKFTQKYAIIQLFENVPEGKQFSASSWPLHATIADTFAIDWDVPTMIEKLTKLLSSHVPATSLVEDDRFFGDQGQVRVVLLKKTDTLVKLHYDVVEALEQGGWRPNDPQFAKGGFLPHSTVQEHARLNKGDEVTFNALTIIDMFPDEDPYQRKILKTIKIGDASR